MRTMLLAAAAALSLGIGSAYAGDGAGPAGGYVSVLTQPDRRRC